MSHSDFELHPDILSRVLFFVQKPAPPPNSGAQRHEIRQDDLASCMRVSTVFNQCAAPLLYKHTITDDIPCLLVGLFDASAHPDVKSKKELLGLVQHLIIEYQERYRDPTYTELFIGQLASCERDRFGKPGGIWEFFNQKLFPHSAYGFNESYANMTFAFQALVRYAKEATGRDMPNEIPPDELVRLPNSMSPFRLTSLSFCTIFGGQSAGWKAILDYMPPFADRVIEARDCLAFLLIVGPRTKHFCCRSSTGPLGVNKFIQMATAPGYKPTMTGHMHEWDEPWMEVQTPTTFVHEKPHSIDGSTTCDWKDGRCSYHTHDYANQEAYTASHKPDIDYAEHATESIVDMIMQEGDLVPKRIWRQWKVGPRVPVKVYINPETRYAGLPMSFTEQEQREWVTMQEEYLRDNLGDKAEVFDLTIGMTDEALACPACGV